MRSPVSPTVCNLYMEDFERLALESAVHPSRWWKWYVDDIHTVLVNGYPDSLINSIPTIQPSLESTTFVSSDDTSDDGQETETEKSHVKQALNINGYPDWLINSIASIQPSQESTTSVLSDDGQETDRDTTTKKPPVRNPQYYLIFKKCRNRSGECLNNMMSRLT